MKLLLNQSLVLTKLSIEKRPVLTNGKVTFEDNPSRTAYIVYDDTQAAPIGFGVKIGATKKTYIIQRRVNEKVIKTKVGNVSDFPSIDKAREKARGLAEAILNTSRNPNK